MYDKYSGRSRRFGFVTMSTFEDVNAAIEKLNDTVSSKPAFSISTPVLLVLDLFVDPNSA